jgi:hypothetical protein
MVTTTLRIAAALVAAALLVPAATLAAMPLGGATYRECNVRDGVTTCKVNQLSVAPSAGKVTKFVAFTRCAPAPFKAPLVMKIDRTGAFALTAKRTDVTSRAIQVAIRGKFVAADRAKGTMRFKRPGCDTGAIKFDVRAALG